MSEPVKEDEGSAGPGPEGSVGEREKAVSQIKRGVCPVGSGVMCISLVEHRGEEYCAVVVYGIGEYGYGNGVA